jgi:hypothetical protein
MYRTIPRSIVGSIASAMDRPAWRRGHWATSVFTPGRIDSGGMISPRRTARPWPASWASPKTTPMAAGHRSTARTTFYIAVADGRLCGSKEGAQKVPDKRLVNWLNRKGHAFQSTEELWAWIKSRTPEEAIALEREESANLPRLVDPCWEYRLSDYREVAPGCWLPMTQVRDLYCLDEDDRLVVEETYRLKITEVKVDAPLPDALFRVEIPEGSKVNDQTKAPRKGKP